MATVSHTTLFGDRITYERPDDDTAAFLARVERAARDPGTSTDALEALVYGPDDPILDQTLTPGRGAVTKDVLRSPLYLVLLDLLDRKREQRGELDPYRAASELRWSVERAATELGVTPAEVQKAIATKRLVALERGPVRLLDPRMLATYGGAGGGAAPGGHGAPGAGVGPIGTGLIAGGAVGGAGGAVLGGLLGAAVGESERSRTRRRR